ncbi:MAG TPA: hypothetical protein VFV67_08380 [Actinophytocola sp.]|uniref:hypothetical protein n=1 Tax=Actinophytocola sp. TaxID=1872138 RepID=UPI002DB8595F|nr:hypothetical protein [Actinophytocola sp.]HEU5470656.1 hypothetical protein [Actinophytocola sp.]
MPANLLTEATWLIPATALTATAITALTRAALSLCQTVVQERSRTTRLTTALKDSTPDQRPEIIRACGHLETLHPKPTRCGQLTKRQGHRSS